METKDSEAIIKILWKWRKSITASVLIGTAITAVLLLLQPNYYQASTIFYPVSSDLLKPVFDGSDRNLLYYGDDRDVDRLLSIAQSTELAQDLIKDYKLAEVYKIDISSVAGRRKLRKRFEKLYEVRKTEYDAINLLMEDRDPERAAELANTMRDKVNKRAQSIIQTALKDIISVSEASLKEKEGRLKEITGLIQELRQKYRIYDTQSQGEALAALEVRAPNDQNVRKYIEDYSSGVSQVMNLENEQTELGKLIARQRNDLEGLRASFMSAKPAIHVIEKARPPDEKSRPKRSLYLMATVILLFAISLLTALTIEKFKEPSRSE